MEALLLETGKSSSHPEKALVRTKRDLFTFTSGLYVKSTCSWQKPSHLVSGEGDGLRLGCKQKSQDGRAIEEKLYLPASARQGIV